MHVVVAGWLLGDRPSGVQHRMLRTLAAMRDCLHQEDRITVLHRKDLALEIKEQVDLPQLAWQSAELPPGPAWRRAIAERRLPTLLRELGANVFEQGFLPLARGISSVGTSIRTCLTIHDLRDLGRFRRRNAWLSRIVTRAACRRADAIIVPSQFVRQELQALTTTKIHVIPAGVTPIQPSGSGSTSPCLLHVGHLEPRKNLELLLRAYADFCTTRKDAPPLTLVGADAGEGPSLHALCQSLDIADSVHFAGCISDDELATHYRSCTALLFPSQLEGFGMPALEAMAAGKPVVVSDRGALPEVVGSAGTVIPATDHRAWSAAMRKVWDQRGEHTGDAERAHAARFTWQECARRTLRVWRNEAQQ